MSCFIKLGSMMLVCKNVGIVDLCFSIFKNGIVVDVWCYVVVIYLKFFFFKGFLFLFFKGGVR